MPLPCFCLFVCFALGPTNYIASPDTVKGNPFLPLVMLSSKTRGVNKTLKHKEAELGAVLLVVILINTYLNAAPGVQFLIIATSLFQMSLNQAETIIQSLSRLT